MRASASAVAVEASQPPVDRRLLAILAVAVLLVGVSIGAELCRRFFTPAAPESLAGDFDFKLPPPAAEAPTTEPEAPVIRDVSAARFLAVLAKETPPAVARRFLEAFTREPGLRQVFASATRRGLDKTPARELVRALMAAPEFSGVVMESRSDPGFQQAFAELTKNPDVGGALRAGTIGLVRQSAETGPATEPTPGAEPATPGGLAGEPPAEPTPQGPEAGQDAPQNEEHEQQAGRDAHDVAPKMQKINSAGHGRSARSYLKSIFAGMSAEQLKKLDETCDKFASTAGCEPEVICSQANLWEECRNACFNSPKCPEDMREAFGLKGRRN